MIGQHIVTKQYTLTSSKVSIKTRTDLENIWKYSFAVVMEILVLQSSLYNRKPFANFCVQETLSCAITLYTCTSEARSWDNSVTIVPRVGPVSCHNRRNYVKYVFASYVKKTTWSDLHKNNIQQTYLNIEAILIFFLTFSLLFDLILKFKEANT